MQPHTWHLRATATGAEAATVHIGRHSITVGRQLAFEPLPQPTALELLASALASDLVVGFHHAARLARVPVQQVELALAYRLENPLTHFGVVGETGMPRLAGVHGDLYVAGELDTAAARSLFATAAARGPVFQSLVAGASIQIDIHTV